MENNPDYIIVAWARKNEKGDLYDFNLQRNPYVDDNIMVPLYMKIENKDNTKD